MTYNHLTTDELVLIESYYKNNASVSIVAATLKRSRETINKVFNFLKEGKTILEFFYQYKENKRRSGRKRIVLSIEQIKYVKTSIEKGWSPDVIKGRNEFEIDCSSRTLYRMHNRGELNKKKLPMKGKRKPNGYKEKRGKQEFKRHISERVKDYPEYDDEFGHLEGDTIVGLKHKSAVITLAERKSKSIITLKPLGRKGEDIEASINEWLSYIPRNLFKSITFDNGKEYSNWKNICNNHDINIYFADPGTPSQRGLNENSNGLLRRDGLPKQMDFNKVDEFFIKSIAAKRNHIPRKSLNYKTPIEVFLSYMDEEILSSLI